MAFFYKDDQLNWYNKIKTIEAQSLSTHSVQKDLDSIFQMINGIVTSRKIDEKLADIVVEQASKKVLAGYDIDHIRQYVLQQLR